MEVMYESYMCFFCVSFFGLRVLGCSILSVYLLICLSMWWQVAKKSQYKKRKNIGHRLKIKKPGTSAVFQWVTPIIRLNGFSKHFLVVRFWLDPG